MKLSEIAVRKAGFIPYVFEDGVPVFMFMIPSHPGFGGDRPQIAKGGIDKGETQLQAGVREAEEELGLRESNIRKKTIQQVPYPSIAVFMGEVRSKKDFGKAHFETGSVHWLTEVQFIERGRDWQVSIVKQAASLLNS